MSFNLVELIRDSFADNIIHRIEAAISATEGQTRAAISSATPGLLHALTRISKNKLGAEALLQAVMDQDDSLLDDLHAELSGEKYKLFANSGSNTLRTLMGNIGANNLAIDVSAQTGMSHTTTSCFLGMLTPVAISVIKRKFGELDGQNSSKLSEMLLSQSDHIADALPAGFFHHQNTYAQPQVSTQTASKPPLSIDQSAIPQESAPFSRTKAIALLVLPVFLFLGYKILFNQSEEPMQLPLDNPELIGGEGTPSAEFTLNGGDSLSDKLQTVLGNIATQLNDIRNIETARAILPELDAEAQKLKAIADELEKPPLNDAARKAAMETIQSKIPHLQIIVDRVYEIEGVKPLIEPAIDNIIENMALLH